jgi:phage/plasmid-like protein (TIGR03299 family)
MFLLGAPGARDRKEPIMQNHTVSSAHLSPINLLGERVEGLLTAEQAMEKGRLANWNVRKAPMQGVDPVTGKTFKIPNRNAVVFDNPTSGKTEAWDAAVSDGFHIIQNEEHAEFLNTLVDESGAHFEMAGSLNGGSRVFLSMKLPGGIQVGGLDPVENSLLAVNDHTGNMSFTLAVLPVRYACSNVLNTLWGGRSNMIRVRHSSGAQKNLVQKAREALELSWDYLDEFQEQAERLINTTLTQSQFEAIIEREFGAADDASAAAITRSERKVEEICGLFADAQTQDGIRDTAWAGFNALTEWADHFAPTRGDDADVARAAKAVFAPSIKNRALELMLAV